MHHALQCLDLRLLRLQHGAAPLQLRQQERHAVALLARQLVQEARGAAFRKRAVSGSVVAAEALQH